MIIPEFIQEAVEESISLLPFLFLIFVFIEIFEDYFSEKLSHITKFSKNFGPLIGASLAVIPQCGFSVIAATLYIKKFITKGTLIAVFISTSDEALPILFANPEHFSLITPVIISKIILGIVSGYLIDLIFKSELSDDKIDNIGVLEEGCCKHDIPLTKNIGILLHPIKHTFNIFVFILIITIFLNYILMNDSAIVAFLSKSTPIQPILSAIVGLIPNCAISVLITLMYIKNTITFGTLMAGLCSSAGLGLLVLFKNNKMSDNATIISILLLISVMVGILFQIFNVSF